MSKAFNNLLKHLGTLNPTEQERAYHWLKRYVDPASSVGGRLLDELRETRFSEGFECPHCSSQHIVRYGKSQGRQRYKCKACCITFIDTKHRYIQNPKEQRMDHVCRVYAEGLFFAEVREDRWS